MPADAGYAKRVLSGSVWMIANTVATRIGSFVSQIFLAWWLTKSDFGIVGIALAISGIASVLRDGGVRQILLKHHAEHEKLLGPCFWMALAFNTVLAILLTGLAFPFARLYEDDRLIVMLAIIGWSIPLGTVGGILLTKLLADMRYRENASVMTASAMTRYVSSVAFAYIGLGPLSFILPNILCALVENVLALYYCRHRPWQLAPSANQWWPLFLRSRWALVAALGIAGMNQGSSAMIGLAAPLEVVGIYTFTFLIVVQVGSLLSTNINQVLVPVFTRLADEEDRKRAAVLRTLRQVTLLATFMSLGLAATYRPFESLVWRERWAASILPVQIIGAGYAINVLLSISLAVQQARGQFRAWGVGLLLLAIGTMLAALVGTLIGKPQLDRALFLALNVPTFWPYVTERIWWSGVYIALASAAFGVVSSLLHLVIALKPLGVRRREVVKNSLTVWSLGLLAGALTISIDTVADESVRRFLSGIFGHDAGVFAAEFLLFIAAGLFFSAVYAFLVRTVVPEALAEAFQITPARFRPHLVRLFRLEQPAAPSGTSRSPAP
ncbi:MAG: oligosaccharide flippase family protein [Planctomycetes bacterium]|nr:oligosaccharide flippase family protein [Planctomycetota bacterium]